MQEKFKKINIVNDQVSGWAKKCFTKFSTLIGSAELGGVQAGTADIVTLFKGMNKVVTSEVDKISERQR